MRSARPRLKYLPALVKSHDDLRSLEQQRHPHDSTNAASGGILSQLGLHSPLALIKRTGRENWDPLRLIFSHAPPGTGVSTFSV